jgi:hypothetical protein
MKRRRCPILFAKHPWAQSLAVCDVVSAVMRTLITRTDGNKRRNVSVPADSWTQNNKAVVCKAAYRVQSATMALSK